MPWLKVGADKIQIDAAGIIDTTGRAPEGLEQNGVSTPTGGGSGGGGGGAAGQGAYQKYVGIPPGYSDMYSPTEHGGWGGAGGGAAVDINCDNIIKQEGGHGGDFFSLFIFVRLHEQRNRYGKCSKISNTKKLKHLEFTVFPHQ